MPDVSEISETRKLTEEQQKEIHRLIEEGFAKKRALGKKGVFISLNEGDERNVRLVAEILDPFLTLLSVEVHYWIKDRRFGRPTGTIYDIMDSCDAQIGLYTNDERTEGGGFRNAGNVILEMGREKPEKKLVLCEEGTIVEGMTYADVPCFKFTRDKYDRLLIDLLHFLKNSDWLEG